MLRILGEEYQGAFVSCDGLINHLSMKHSETLRVLDLRWEFVGVDALKTLCNRCVGLQELILSVSIVGLVCRFAASYRRRWLIGFKFAFAELVPCMTELHTAVFEMRNVKASQRSITTEEATNIITKGMSLRRLLVSGVRWEASRLCPLKCIT